MTECTHLDQVPVSMRGLVDDVYRFLSRLPRPLTFIFLTLRKLLFEQSFVLSFLLGVDWGYGVYC